MTDSLTIWGTDYTGVKGFKAGAQSDGPTGKNLYNPATKTDGYFINSSGVLTEESTCSYSDYIAVVPGENYVWSGVSGKTGSNNKRVVGYTTAKAYSQVIKAVSVTGINIPYENSFTVPTGVYFVRLSYNTADSELMIEHGSTKTSYEPYTNIVNYAYLRPQGTKSITENGTGIDVAEYAAVDVSVSGGIDIPTFTVTLSSDRTTVVSVTCDKTFAECSALLANEEYGARLNAIITGGSSVTDGLTTTYQERDGNEKYTEIIYSYGLNLDISYTPTSLTASIPSWLAETLSVTENGTYYPNAGAFTEVNVNVSGGGSPTIDSLTVTPSTSQQVFNSSSVDGYKPVTVQAMPSGTEGTPTATKGTVSNHAITVTPSVTNTAGYISGGTISGTGVSVAASELVSGTLSITENGSGIDVTNYAAVDVSISSGGIIVTETQDEHGGTVVEITSGTTVTLQSKSVTPASSSQTILPDTGYDGMSEVIVAAVPGPNLQTKSATPTESAQTITPDQDYDGLSSVSVGAISTTYVGSGIARCSSSDVGIGAGQGDVWISVSSGYYSSSVTKYINNAILTPSATKGTVSNHSINVTPSVSYTSGYMHSAGSVSGTAITVSASELVSGSETKSANGTYDVTTLASLVVSIPIVTYYTGSSAPSSSLGSNGDIYLQTS